MNALIRIPNKPRFRAQTLRQTSIPKGECACGLEWSNYASLLDDGNETR